MQKNQVQKVRREHQLISSGAKRFPALFKNAWLMALLLLGLCSQFSLANATQAKTILVLGDSLSAAYGLEQHEGWVYLLQERLKARQGTGKQASWRIANASISGETTSGGLSRLPAALIMHKPALVIVELGANDGLRGQSLGAMKRNLSSIIERSEAAGAQVLLLGMRIPSNYGPAYTERFYQTYQMLGQRPGVALVDFFLAPVALKPQMFLEDRIHPNAAAQPLLLEHLWQSIEPLLAD